MARPGPNAWNPEKYPQKTRKYPQQWTCLVFGYFSVFWGYVLGAQNFGQEGIFSVFFVEIPGQAISGLCSRPGRTLREKAFKDNSVFAAAPLDKRIAVLLKNSENSIEVILRSSLQDLDPNCQIFCIFLQHHVSERTITRVSRNQTLARIK